jgi:DNA-binding transcriptional MerR regulator
VRAISAKLSTAEVSRILRMPEARVRALARAGLCRPARRGRRYAFSFQDLVVLRTAQGLIENKVPPARVRDALAALLRQLPARGARGGGGVASRDRTGRAGLRGG